MEIMTATQNNELFFYYTQDSKFKKNEHLPSISKTTPLKIDLYGDN